MKPDDVGIRQVLANIYFTQGNRDAAAEQWKAVLDRLPGHAGANKGIGMILMQAGQMAGAVGFLQRALIAEPRDQETRKCLAFALLAVGRVQEAIRQFQGMLRQDPNEPVALNSLAWLLATHPDAAVRNGPEAVKLAQKAVGQRTDDQPELLDTLAAAHAEAGQFKEAVETAEKARTVASQWGRNDLAAGIEQRLMLYKEGKPYHEAAAGTKKEEKRNP